MNIDELITKNMELEQLYESKYQGTQDGDLYPDIWYSIEDYELRAKLLEEAINSNQLLYQLETVQRLIDNELDNRIRNNIQKSIELWNDKIEKGK